MGYALLRTSCADAVTNWALGVALHQDDRNIASAISGPWAFKAATHGGHRRG